jgi:hypothetical protein
LNERLQLKHAGIVTIMVTIAIHSTYSIIAITPMNGVFNEANLDNNTVRIIASTTNGKFFLYCGRNKRIRSGTPMDDTDYKFIPETPFIIHTYVHICMHAFYLAKITWTKIQRGGVCSLWSRTTSKARADSVVERNIVLRTYISNALLRVKLLHTRCAAWHDGHGILVPSCLR